MTSTIYLIGDGILDNGQWLADPNKDLRHDITAHGYTVHSYAADDMRVRDIIDGITPNSAYRAKRAHENILDKHGKLFPLKLLTESINANKSFSATYKGISPIAGETNNNNMVVLSMGGIDISSKVLNLVLGADFFINSVLTEAFLIDFERVIATTRSSCEKILLVSVYLPYLGPGSKYGKYSSYSKTVVGRWNKFIHSVAKKHNIPVLDLQRTFDVTDRSHYGKEETHPSNKSSKCIADCISYIYKKYDGYHVYYAPACNSGRITKD
jgi:hypothetical protein